MSADSRYYYVDAQNQAAGPISMAGLLALKAAGTVNDSTLVVAEGGSEWVAFSTLKPEALRGPTPAPVGGPREGGQPANSQGLASQAVSAFSPSSLSSEPHWASQLTQKMDRLIATMEKLVVSLEKSRPPIAAAPAPATAALHAEKINLNPAPKPGIAASTPGVVPPRVAPSPAMAPKPAALPGAAPRPGVSTALSPLAVPANAQKSPLPLPSLGKPPGPAPAGLPKTAAPVPPKGNIFSKFIKK